MPEAAPVINTTFPETSSLEIMDLFTKRRSLKVRKGGRKKMSRISVRGGSRMFINLWNKSIDIHSSGIFFCELLINIAKKMDISFLYLLPTYIINMHVICQKLLLFCGLIISPCVIFVPIKKCHNWYSNTQQSISLQILLVQSSRKISIGIRDFEAKIIIIVICHHWW